MVPSIKKTMESLIFEVKLMLENNDAGAAFWLGNLKHRNLRGEEISSQLPVASEEEQDENSDSLSKKTSRKRSRANTHKSNSTPRKSKGAQATGNSKKRRGARQSRADVQDVGSNNDDHEHRIHTKRYALV